MLMNIHKYGCKYYRKSNYIKYQNRFSLEYNSKIHDDSCLKWTQGLFCRNYQVATLSILNLTVSGIIIPNLKLIGQF